MARMMDDSIRAYTILIAAMFIMLLSTDRDAMLLYVISEPAVTETSSIAMAISAGSSSTLLSPHSVSVVNCSAGFRSAVYDILYRGMRSESGGAPWPRLR